MVLKLETIKKQYDGFTLDCSMELRPGYITGLIGPNGAGKTTIFKSILGLTSIDEGRIEILGKNHQELTEKDKELIGVSLAESGFSGYLTIMDLVTIMKNMYTTFDKKEFIERCRQGGLPLHKKIRDFSAGMKARLKVLAALSHQASLLILDEPTAGLDVIAREELLDYIRSYMQEEERSVLISSHISGDLERLCDDIYLIDRGHIVLHEETDILLDQYGLLKISGEQYEEMDKTHIIKRIKEDYGFRCLTDCKAFYTEKYPEIVIEKGNIDELITLMIRGGSI